MKYEPTGRIKFVKVPEGQAPLWVREKWVGVTVPCYPYIFIPREVELVGVKGDIVAIYTCAFAPLTEALEALERHSPEAARWWRNQNIGGRALNFFAFDVGSFEIVSGVQEREISVYDDLETGRWCKQ